jgi:nucleoside phosphorylase
MSKGIDAVILFALQEEFDYFEPEIPAERRVEQDHASGRAFLLFDYPTEVGAAYHCVTSFVGTMGSQDAGFFTREILGRYNPNNIVLVGIAGSLSDDVRLGDIVVADEVTDYIQDGRVAEGGLIPSGRSYRPHVRLTNSVRYLSITHSAICAEMNAASLAELKRTVSPEALANAGTAARDGAAHWYCGHLASSPVVGASSTWANLLRSLDRKFLALEMESAGVMNAVYQAAGNERVLVIRGISDMSDERKVELDGLGSFRGLAMKNALRLLKTLFRAGKFERAESDLSANDLTAPNIESGQPSASMASIADRDAEGRENVKISGGEWVKAEVASSAHRLSSIPRVAPASSPMRRSPFAVPLFTGLSLDPSSVQAARREMLQQRLEQVGHSVVFLGAGQHQIGEELHDLVRERQERLNDDEIKESGYGYVRSDGAANRAAWESLRQRESECGPLFRDALAYFLFQANRPPAVDLAKGPARLAVALVSELQRACPLRVQPFVVFGEYESEVAQIIRLRFPLGDIWDLPIAAHQYGKLAAYQLDASIDGLQRTFPFKEIVRELMYNRGLNDFFGGSDEGRKRAHLHDYFADMFATYVMGPSFALAALILRFDVVSAFEDRNLLHPSYAMRAAAILATLQRMNREAPTDRAFVGAIDFLSTHWLNLLHSAELTDATERMEQASNSVQEIVDHLYFSVLRLAVRKARYVTWDIVEQVWDNEVITSSGGEENQGTYQIRDLLNAAWLVRVAGKLETSAISQRVDDIFCG